MNGSHTATARKRNLVALAHPLQSRDRRPDEIQTPGGASDLFHHLSRQFFDNISLAIFLLFKYRVKESPRDKRIKENQAPEGKPPFAQLPGSLGQQPNPFGNKTFSFTGRLFYTTAKLALQRNSVPTSHP